MKRIKAVLRYYLCPWGIIKRLRLAMDILSYSSIYPKSAVGGTTPYEKRTEYMEGWNDATMMPLQRLCEDDVLLDGDW